MCSTLNCIPSIMAHTYRDPFLYNTDVSWTIQQLLRLTIFSPEMENFFKELINSNIKEREEKGIVRSDMIQLLLEERSGVLDYSEGNAKRAAGTNVLTTVFGS